MDPLRLNTEKASSSPPTTSNSLSQTVNQENNTVTTPAETMARTNSNKESSFKKPEGSRILEPAIPLTYVKNTKPVTSNPQSRISSHGSSSNLSAQSPAFIPSTVKVAATPGITQAAADTGRRNTGSNDGHGAVDPYGSFPTSQKSGSLISPPSTPYATPPIVDKINKLLQPHRNSLSTQGGIQSPQAQTGSYGVTGSVLPSYLQTGSAYNVGGGAPVSYGVSPQTTYSAATVMDPQNFQGQDIRFQSAFANSQVYPPQDTRYMAPVLAASPQSYYPHNNGYAGLSSTGNAQSYNVVQDVHINYGPSPSIPTSHVASYVASPVASSQAYPYTNNASNYNYSGSPQVNTQTNDNGNANYSNSKSNSKRNKSTQDVRHNQTSTYSTQGHGSEYAQTSKSYGATSGGESPANTTGNSIQVFSTRELMHALPAIPPPQVRTYLTRGDFSRKDVEVSATGVHHNLVRMVETSYNDGTTHTVANSDYDEQHGERPYNLIHALAQKNEEERKDFWECNWVEIQLDFRGETKNTDGDEVKSNGKWIARQQLSVLPVLESLGPELPKYAKNVYILIKVPAIGRVDPTLRQCTKEQKESWGFKEAEKLVTVLDSFVALQKFEVTIFTPSHTPSPLCFEQLNYVLPFYDLYFQEWDLKWQAEFMSSPEFVQSWPISYLDREMHKIWLHRDKVDAAERRRIEGFYGAQRFSEVDEGVEAFPALELSRDDTPILLTSEFDTRRRSDAGRTFAKGCSGSGSGNTDDKDEEGRSRTNTASSGRRRFSKTGQTFGNQLEPRTPINPNRRRSGTAPPVVVSSAAKAEPGNDDTILETHSAQKPR